MVFNDFSIKRFMSFENIEHHFQPYFHPCSINESISTHQSIENIMEALRRGQKQNYNIVKYVMQHIRVIDCGYL